MKHNMTKAWLKELRVVHYFKNLLVFMPIVFGGQLLDTEPLRKSVICFFCFCMVSSAVYLINDIQDVETDRLHEKKKNRPIAAGIISIPSAWTAAAFLLAGGIFLTFLLGSGTLAGLLVTVLYFIINMAYSVLGVKNIPILDVFFLAAVFLMRVYMGGIVAGISISSWLYLVVLTGALYLGFGKRRNELSAEGTGTRKVLQFYNVAFLDKNMHGCMTMAVIFFSLWCQQKKEVYLVLIPFLLAILFRYNLDIEQKANDGDPVSVILQDKILIGIILVFGLAILTLLYVF